MIKIPKWLADLGLQINRLYYKQLSKAVYGQGKGSPAWFDHRIDLYYHWPHNLFWLERGLFPRKYMFEGCRVLDLFCGDGFFSRYFYSTIAGHIDALDKDPEAIAHAQRWFSCPRINYVRADALNYNFPRCYYDVIVWFEGIEHLSAANYSVLVKRLKEAMDPGGVLIGSTPIFPTEYLGQMNWEHENEFTDVTQLKKFLSQNFSEIRIEETYYPLLGGGQRHTAYFTLKQPK